MPDSDYSDKDPSINVLFDVLTTLLAILRQLEHSSRFMSPASITEIATDLQRMHQVSTEVLTQLLSLELSAKPLATLSSDLESALKLFLDNTAEIRSKKAEEIEFTMLFRALGSRSQICPILYPYAGTIGLIHDYFLDERRLGKPSKIEPILSNQQTNVEPGIHHIENERHQKGGFSLYIPETYDSRKSYPLVMALHGGSGHGSRFLWSWIRTARSEDLVLVTPTAVGGTWAIMGQDFDSPNLERILAMVQASIGVDTKKLLLTGMSDGGTFTYTSGCLDSSPFTHLAPFSASFHPMITEFMSSERLQGLPIYISHGALDWLFTVDVAQMAEYTLSASGANVTYREISDLAHTYPEEENPNLVDWFLQTDA
ncbi:MAG: phospholipase [Gammaproteobacteria bacterium]|nr:phospholipase [Gammaproteobacteria bacterium]